MVHGMVVRERLQVLELDGGGMAGSGFVCDVRVLDFDVVDCRIDAG